MLARNRVSAAATRAHQSSRLALKRSVSAVWVAKRMQEGWRRRAMGPSCPNKLHLHGLVSGSTINQVQLLTCLYFLRMFVPFLCFSSPRAWHRRPEQVMQPSIDD